MIIKIKHNLISNTYYVYRRPSSTKAVAVELRKRRTKAMLDFMKTAKIKDEGNFVIYVSICYPHFIHISTKCTFKSNLFYS